VGGVEVIGQSSGHINGGEPKGGDACPPSADPNGGSGRPDPSVGEGGLQDDLDTAARVDAKSLDPKSARILPEVVATTWEVDRVREILLSTAA
jgi:hypothetical protein